MCWTDTLVHPIEAEDNAIALIRFESGRDRPVRGQLDVPRRHGPARRGRRHRRHDLAQPLPAHRLRDVHAPARAAATSPRRPRRASGWLFPVGDEVSELGYVDMFTDMFDAIDEGRAAAGDVLRRLRRQRRHGRLLPLGDEPRSGSRSSSSWRGGATPRIAPSAPRASDGKTVIKEELLPDGRRS